MKRYCKAALRAGLLLSVLLALPHIGQVSKCEAGCQVGLKNPNRDSLVVVAAFFNVDLVQACLDSILRSSSGEPFPGDVVVVQQPSNHTEEMTQMIQERRKMDNGSAAGILHHILTEDTPLVGQLWAMPFAHNVVEPSKYAITCISDGDVILFGDWLAEIRSILDGYPSVYWASVSLHPFNNIDPGYILNGAEHADFIEAPTGMQMVCFRTPEFIRLYKSGTTIQDTHILEWIKSQGRRVVRTKRNHLVHMMWSVYVEKIPVHKDYLEYKNERAKSGNLWESFKKAHDANMTIVF